MLPPSETRDGPRRGAEAVENVTKGTGRSDDGTAPFGPDPIPAGEVAQAVLLGCAMWKPAAAAEVARLDPDTWTREGHRVLAGIIGELVAENIQVNPPTVVERAARTDRYDVLGTGVAVHDLFASVDAPSGWPVHLRTVVAEAADRARAKELIAELRGLGWDVREVAA